MKINFRLKKDKKITLNVKASNVDLNILRYWFKISFNGIDYCIPGKNLSDKVIFNIPSLDSFIYGIKSGLYKGLIEVVDGSSFYKKLWEDSIEVYDSQSLSVEISEKDILESLTEEIKQEIKPKKHRLKKVKQTESSESNDDEISLSFSKVEVDELKKRITDDIKAKEKAKKVFEEERNKKKEIDNSDLESFKNEMIQKFKKNQ